MTLLYKCLCNVLSVFLKMIKVKLLTVQCILKVIISMDIASV